MISRPIITEISKNSRDHSFSMDELFYRYFDEMPSLVFQSGSTDLYDTPAQAGRGQCDDEDLEINPQRGPEDLEKAINRLFDFLSSKKVKDTDRSDTKILKNCNFSSNMFTAVIVFTLENILVQLQVAPGLRETMTQFTVMGTDDNHPLWVILRDHCNDYIQPVAIRKDEINIIMVQSGEFYLKAIPLVNHNQEFSYDFYNQDFEPVSKRVVEALQSHNESGLVLFHGNPGTGKTSFLKYLLHTINRKKLIYLPPDLIESLSSPSFMSFLLSQASNSILLIEDAENVLKHRQAGGNQSVSNILNISDGILGDILRLQIVCTFNSKLEEIDQALLRPGRLVAEYRFEKLTTTKTAFLMNKLYGPVTYKNAEMTLADIFNFNNMPNKSKNTKTSVGFINTNN